MTHIHHLTNVKAGTTNLRKLQESNKKTRCRPASSWTREKLDTIPEAYKTRSVSPEPHSPCLNSKLPRKKFNNIYSKIIVQLETVKSLSENKVNKADNIADLRKQLQRADEFSIRFSRNNLYEIKRIICDIKKFVVQFPFENLSSNESKVLCKKIILGYQAASQSLQIYINYVKNPANLEVPEKINELLLLIADLFLCCENLLLPPEEVHIQNDGVKICNELMAIMNSKMTAPEDQEVKEQNFIKKKTKVVLEDPRRKNKFAMYRAKLTNSKMKAEIPPKKFGMTGLLGNKARRLKKKDERKAKITHDIYTQKLNNTQSFGSKSVKFEPREKTDNGDKKLLLKRPKYWTPREVRSQDDDVETMVQTIGDDEGVTSRANPNLEEVEDVEASFNKSNFRELLLEAIEDLQNSDKKEQKETLKKLLNSIQNCSKSQNNSPRHKKVKVFYFKHKDPEQNPQKPDENKTKDNEENSNVDLEVLFEKRKARDEILSRERKLNIIFKTLKPKKFQDTQSEIVPMGKIKLKLPEEITNEAHKYRKSFAEYRRNNIMYKKTLEHKPWELVGKFSDQIILDLIREISREFENDAILKKLFLNELSEVAY